MMFMCNIRLVFYNIIALTTDNAHVEVGVASKRLQAELKKRFKK